MPRGRPAKNNITPPFPKLQAQEQRLPSGQLTKSQVLRRMAEGLYIEHPEQWPVDALGITPDSWQSRSTRKLLLGEKKRLSLRAGHGVGKSFWAAILAHLFLMNFAPSKVIVSGPTGKQTRTQFWAYLNTIWNMSVFKDDLEWQRTKMFVKGQKNEENWFATWVSSKNPKNMEGYHGPIDGKNLLWIIEEAKGVSDAAFEALTGALSQDDNYLYISSTCGPSIGHFWESHTKLSDLYETECIPSTESARVSPRKIEIWKRQYQGEDSPIYQARVMAHFPSSDDMTIVSLEQLEAAVERDDEEDNF